MNWFGLKEVIISYTFKFLLVLIILIVANYFINFIKKSLEKLLEKANAPTLASLLSDLIKFILWILTFAIILNLLGLKETSLALGGSIMIIGLGLTKSISNVAGDLIAGIFLIIDEDFQVGIRVKTNGVEGIIESLDIRKTKIIDVDGNLHVIPNKKIDESVLIINQKNETY